MEGLPRIGALVISSSVVLGFVVFFFWWEDCGNAGPCFLPPRWWLTEEPSTRRRRTKMTVDDDADTEHDVSLATTTLQPRRKLVEEKDRTKTSSSWHGLPLTHQDGPPPISNAHCIGENFNASTSWQYRSCEFTYLCWDETQHDFVVFRSDLETKLFDYLYSSPSAALANWQNTVTLSTLLSPTHSAVSLSSLLLLVGEAENESPGTSPWFPQVLNHADVRDKYSHGYFLVPDDVVWIPWQPPLRQKGSSPRHWLWTAWYPLFVLSSLFSYSPTTTTDNKGNNSPFQLLPIIASSTRLSESQKSLLQDMPRFGKTSVVLGDNDAPPQKDDASRLICARHTVSGVGQLAPTLGETDSIGHGPTLQGFALHVRRQFLSSAIRNTATEHGSGIYLMDDANLDDALRQQIHTTLPSVQRLDAAAMQQPENLGALAQALSKGRLLVMTLSLSCVAPLLVPDGTRIVVIFQPVALHRFTDCVYMLNNAAYLHVEWVDTSPSGDLQLDRLLSANMERYLN